MLNYNEVVSKLREIARDSIRLIMVARRRSNLYEANQTLDSINEEIIYTNKKFAIEDYKISKIDDNDPEKEDKLKLNAEVKKSLENTIERCNKEIETQNKIIADITTSIEDVQDGKVKINTEELNAVTKDLIKKVTESIATEVK